MSGDHTDSEKEAIYQLGRKHGEELDTDPLAHQIKHEELARLIRDEPDLDYEEPRELAELLHSLFEMDLYVGSDENHFRIPPSTQEEERYRQQQINELTEDFQGL